MPASRFDLMSHVDDLIQDLRFAMRSLAKSPLLVLVVVGSLALGIGANSSIFSLVNTLLLRPIPAEHPERLVSIFTSESSGERYGGSSYPDYLDFRERNEALSSLAAYSVAPMSLTIEGHSQRVLGALCTGNYMPTLGVHAALGRTLGPADDEPGAPPAVFVSHGMWARRLGSDPALPGKTLLVNGHPFTVAGVAPEEFRGMVMGVTPDLFVTIATKSIANPSNDRLDHRGHRWLLLLGRLAPGHSLSEAQARLSAISAQLAREYPEADSGRVVSMLPESESRVFPRFQGAVIGFMTLLMVVVGLVLLVACANVAGLLLARGAGRRREIGIRFALGASRGRIVRQLLTEGLLLGLAAGVVGLMLAHWGAAMLLAFKPPLPIDVSLDLSPDRRVAAFTLVVSIVTAVLFSLAPALDATRAAPAPALADGPMGGPRRSRLRSALVIGQVALSVLLLIGGGLLLRGLEHAHALDPGFDVDHTFSTSIDLRLHGTPDAAGPAFYRDLLDRVRAVPGVAAAALDEIPPLGLGGRTYSMAIEGYTQDPREHLEVGNDVVSAGYFSTIGIPILRGREFDPEDRADGQRVAIVNEAFARRFWPGKDPIGRRISLDASGGGDWRVVVGVAKTARYRSLSEEPRPFFYLPFEQMYASEMTLMVRTQGNPRGRIAAVRDAVHGLDPTLPLFDVKTMDEHLGISLTPARLASSVLGWLGVFALVLACVGLYGVVAYGVSQRTREIGVRVALGARPADVLALVVGQGMRLAAFGMGIGVVASLLVTRLIVGLLYGVSPADPITFAGIALVLALAAFTACWFPARRATRVDPMVALRSE